MIVHNVPLNSIRPPKWGATYMLRPEKMLLVQSLREYGWLQPLVIKKSDQTIIDGTKRWDTALSDDKFLRAHGSDVPVIYHDLDEVDAMVAHVRLNRSRGNIHPVGLSALVKRIVDSGKYDANDLANLFIMSEDEIDLLLSSGLLKNKNWKEYDYSRAWVPIEVPVGTNADSPTFERPPNLDR